MIKKSVLKQSNNSKVHIIERKRLFPAQSAVEVVFFVTNQCPGSCPYCFVDRSPSKCRTLHPDEIRDFLQHLLSYVTHEQKIVFYWQGAEATLAPAEVWKEYEDIIQNFSHTGEVENVLVTGTFSKTENVVQVIETFTSLDRIVFSADPARGPEHIQRANATLRECRQAFILQKKDPRRVSQSAIITLTPLLLGKEQETVEKYINEFGIMQYRLRELVPAPRSKPSSIPTLAELYSILSAFLALWLQSDGKIQFEPFDSILCAIVGGTASGTCTFHRGCANLISLQPGGKISACDLAGELSDELLFGHTEHFDKVVDRAEDWRNRLPKECQQCSIVSACNGGCPSRAFAVTGSIHNKDPYCAVFKALYNDIHSAYYGMSREKQRLLKESVQWPTLTTPTFQLN